MKQHCDNDNVADGLDRDDQTLDDLLETLGSVDGTEGTENAEYTKDLEKPNAGAGKDGNEGDGDDDNVEDVEGGTAERALVEQEAIGDELEAALEREDSREDVVKVVEELRSNNKY